MLNSLSKKDIIIIGLSVALVFSISISINTYSNYIKALESIEKSGDYLLDRAMYHIRAETEEDAQKLVKNTLDNFDIVLATVSPQFDQNLIQLLRNKKSVLVNLIDTWDIYNQPLPIREDISLILQDLLRKGEFMEPSTEKIIGEYMMENEQNNR